MFSRRQVQRWLDEQLRSDDESQSNKRWRHAVKSTLPFESPVRVDSLPSRVDSAMALSDACSSVVGSEIQDGAGSAMSFPVGAQSDAVNRFTANPKDQDSGYDGSDTSSLDLRPFHPACQSGLLNVKLSHMLLAYMICTYQIGSLRQHGNNSSSGSAANYSSSQGGACDHTSNKHSRSSRGKGKRKAEWNDLTTIKREKKGPPCKRSCNQGGFLACPFAKANFDRYRNVHGQCTHPQGFEGLADLKDHLKRCHSPRSYCWVCRKRFGNGSRNNPSLTAHLDAGTCQWKAPSNDEPEWMDGRQDEILNFDWHRLVGDSRQKWCTVFSFLFPSIQIPCPCYNFYVLNPELEANSTMPIPQASHGAPNQEADVGLGAQRPHAGDAPDDELTWTQNPYIPQPEDYDSAEPWTSFNVDQPENSAAGCAGPSAVSSAHRSSNPAASAFQDSGYGASNNSQGRQRKPDFVRPGDVVFDLDSHHLASGSRDDAPPRSENVDDEFVQRAIKDFLHDEQHLESVVKGADRDVEQATYGAQTGDESFFDGPPTNNPISKPPNMKDGFMGP